MATLAVWRFDGPTAADEVAMTLQALNGQGGAALCDTAVCDAATVSWDLVWKKPSTRQLTGTEPDGNLGSAFWGLMFGMIFFVPLLGAAIGAAGGALTGSLTDVGIDDSFINKVRDQVTPGTSALFVLGPDAAVDTLENAFAERPVGRIATNLTAEQDEALRRVFAEEAVATP
jgi:uncharacterized membrane protein